eukprot:scaffold1130_cov195-Pinguiococcus_pyrenoidosus.AAC.85
MRHLQQTHPLATASARLSAANATPQRTDVRLCLRVDAALVPPPQLDRGVAEELRAAVGQRPGAVEGPGSRGLQEQRGRAPQHVAREADSGAPR